jgi:signal transduction histidine kinase
MNVQELIDDVTKLIAVQLQLNSNIELLSMVAYDVSTFIYSDYQRLKQILINLMRNSIKFTKMGSIKISVRKVILQIRKNKVDKFTKKKTLASEETLEAIQFEVFDTGLGISRKE